MELLPLVCVSLLTWSGTTFAVENETTIIKVKEGINVTLTCSLSTEDITNKKFDWKKDDQKQVFLYNNGIDPHPDPQFKDRVSYFPDELKSGNASITIRNTKVADGGKYTCIFPDLQPEQRFHMKLVVGSAPKPYIKHLQQTRYWARLQCETHGDPQPELHWQDSAGNNLPAEEPQVSPQGDQFYVTLQITVNKTGVYRCVATQEEIRHQINDTTPLYIQGSASGLVAGSVLKLFLLMVFLVFLF